MRPKQRATFGQRVEWALEARGYTKKLLANRIGIAAGTLTRCVGHDDIPNLHTAIKIADELNVSLDWLVGREGREYDNPV